MTRVMSTVAFVMVLTACGSLDQESLEASFPTTREAYIDCRFRSDMDKHHRTALYHYARDEESLWLDTSECFQARADLLECLLQDVDVCTASTDSVECKALRDALYVGCLDE